MMRYTAVEKFEIIRLVEQADGSVKHKMEELVIAYSTFYDCYKRYQKERYEGLANRCSQLHQFWNHIPDAEREQVVHIALKHPESSPLELDET